MDDYQRQALQQLLAQYVEADNGANDKRLTSFERDAWQETAYVIDAAMGLLEAELPDYVARLDTLIVDLL